MFLQFFSICSPSEPLKDPSPTAEAAAANNKQIPTITVKPSLSKSKTQISSVYTKLSSIKPTTTTAPSTANSRSSSIPNYLKPVKTTQIGSSQMSPVKMSSGVNTARSPVKSPKRIPQLVKPTIVKSSKSLISFMPPKCDDSNGNSATSSLSTSSSNSSLNTSPVRHFVWKFAQESDSDKHNKVLLNKWARISGRFPLKLNFLSSIFKNFFHILFL